MLNEVKHLGIRFFAGACPEEVESKGLRMTVLQVISRYNLC